jgi:hypothetical protein
MTISYDIKIHDITELTWPMWEACGIECPAMIGADCPRKDGDGLSCPGWSSAFPNAAAEVVHSWTMDSGQSDTCGETESPIGWNALFRNPDKDTHGGPMGAGLILSVSTQGFHHLTRYEATEELEADWSALQDKEAEYDRANCLACPEGQDCVDHDDED